MVIKGYDVAVLLKGAARETITDRIPGLAAQTAYYFFFSLFPILLFLTPLLALVGDRDQTMAWIEGQLSGAVGPSAYVPIHAALREVLYSHNAPGLMSLGALFAAWSGSNIFGALMNALNAAYDVPETRSWVRRQAIRLGVFVVAALLVVTSSVVLLGGAPLAGWIMRQLGVGAAGREAWLALQAPLAFVVAVAVSFVTLRFLPDVKQKNGMVLAASMVTTLLWVIATLVFRIYVQNFGNFTATYGTIGGIIALLTWMYYTMFVVLFGGEIAAELHHGTGATKPLGGAVYHGRIVAAEGPELGSVARGNRLK